MLDFFCGQFAPYKSYNHCISVADPIRIRMDPHDFGLLDPHPESAFQMRIPDADADPG
jgi:hypothetical protein